MQSCNVKLILLEAQNNVRIKTSRRRAEGMESQRNFEWDGVASAHLGTLNSLGSKRRHTNMSLLSWLRGVPGINYRFAITWPSVYDVEEI